MSHHASTSRRQLFSTVGRVAAGLGAVALAAGPEQLIADGPTGDPANGGTGDGNSAGNGDGDAGRSVTGRASVTGGAIAAAPAERLLLQDRVLLQDQIAFPFAGFAPGDLVCLNNFGTCRRRHEGVDIGELRRLDPLVPLVACVDGEITQRESRVLDRPGRFVVLHGDDGRWYRYHHLDEIAEEIEVGQRVRVGQQLGTMGKTGNTNWPHLHFEAWVGEGAFQAAGTPLDPVPLMAVPPSVELRTRLCD